MVKLKKCFEKPSVFFEYISCALLILVCIAAFLNVLARVIFSKPIYGTLEIVQYGVLVAMCLALPASTFYGSHARVEFVTEKLPFIGKKILRVLTDVVGIAMFCFILINMIDPMLSILGRGRTTDVFHVPYYLVHLSIMIGIVLMLLVLIFQLIQNLLLNKVQFEKMEKEQLQEDVRREANIDLSGEEVDQ
jgi:TRAP-type C4-dicarboxylate transport system permease small subunit